MSLVSRVKARYSARKKSAPSTSAPSTSTTTRTTSTSTGGGGGRGSSNVQPSGRFTASGQPIYEKAPTKTDVAREVAEKRVQTFGSGGVKLSDTQRVKVTVGGEEKFVTPKKVLATERKGTIAYEEAQRKLESIKKLESTISARLQRESREKAEVKQDIVQQEETRTKEEPIILKGQTRDETIPPTFSSRILAQGGMSSMFGGTVEEVDRNMGKVTPTTTGLGVGVFGTAYGGIDISGQISKPTTKPTPMISSAGAAGVLAATDDAGSVVTPERPISGETKKQPLTPLNINQNVGDSFITAATPEESKVIKKRTSGGFKFIEDFKKTFQFGTSSRDTFTGSQKLEIAVTGRNPVTGEIESQTDIRLRNLAGGLGLSAGIFSFSAGVPTVLSGLNKLGNIAKSTRVVQVIDKTGKFGRVLTGLFIRGTETAITVRGGKEIVDVLAPAETKQESVTGVSESEIKDIFAEAKAKEMGARFRVEGRAKVPFTDVEIPGTGPIPEGIPLVGGWGLKRFFSGVIGTLVPGASSTKDVFRESVTQQSEAKGLYPGQISLVEQRQEQKRRGLGVVQTIALLQSEAFANIAGGKEVELARQANKFSTAKDFFTAKIVPGSIEAGTSTYAILQTTESRLPAFIPRIDTVQLNKGYDTAIDPTAINKTINVTETQFAELGIVEGKPIPASIFPDSKSNVIFNIMGTPTSKDVITQTQSGDQLLTTTETITTTPLREVTLSQSKPAQEPRTDILRGLFVKDGEQKQFVPSKALVIAGSIPIGILSAGFFGILEGKFTGPLSSRAVQTVGYTSDIAEAPGDFITPLITSDGGTSSRTRSGASILTGVFNQAPTKTDISIKLDSKDIEDATSVQRVQTITAIRTLDFTKDISQTKEKKGRTKSFDVSDIVQQTQQTGVTTQTEVATLVNNIATTDIKTDVLTTTDTLPSSLVNELSLTDTKADTKTQQDTISDVNTNVNVFTPKLFPFIPTLDFFGGESGVRGRKKKGKETRYTPDFIAVILNQFGKAPPKGKLFTGQERRFKIKGIHKSTTPILSTPSSNGFKALGGFNLGVDLFGTKKKKKKKKKGILDNFKL